MRDPLEELEAAARMLLVQAKAFRELKERSPLALKTLKAELSELNEALRGLVSQLYALEVRAKGTLGEDNSAEALRREYLF